MDKILSEKDTFFKRIHTAFNRSIQLAKTNIRQGTSIYNPTIHKLLEYVYQNEMRKGGVVPSIEHPYAVANMILAEIISLRNTDKVVASTQNIGFHINDLLNILAIALMHDVVEDYAEDVGIKFTSSSEVFDMSTTIDIDFIKVIHAHFNELLLLCKHRGKTRLTSNLYYASILHNERVCIVKLADRLHNTLSLINTPSIVTEKMKLTKQQDFDRYYGRMVAAVTTPLFAAIANGLYDQLEVATNKLMQLEI